MLNEIKIKYTDIAVGAKENFEYTMSNIYSWTPIDILYQEDIDFPTYGIVGEMNQYFLDDTQEFLPSDRQGITVGLWNKLVSDGNGKFEEPIILSMEAEQNYTSQGFTFNFDTKQGTHPKQVTVRWYRGALLLEEEDFIVDSSEYYFKKLVQNYNKVEFEFNSMNMPYSRLRIEELMFGQIRTYRNDELAGSVKINSGISAIGNEIVINTMDFKLVTKDNTKLLWQSKQPLYFYINDELKGLYFVREGNRVANEKYEVKTEDYIGLMDTSYFKGGIYNNYSTEQLIDDIFTQCNIPYEIDGEIPIETLSGHIGYVTSREALQQVLFACGMVCDTSNEEVVRIFNVDLESRNTYTEDDILKGQKSKSEKNLTAVNLKEHFYKSQTAKSDLLYDASQSGECVNKMIKFTKPYHSLVATNGTILESNVNYAIVTMSSTGTLSGNEYEETTREFTVKNPNVNVGDVENEINVDTATLISDTNAEFVANRIYNYYLDREIVTAKIVGLEEALGQMITMSNTYLDDKTGIIETLTYTANGDYAPEITVR